MTDKEEAFRNIALQRAVKAGTGSLVWMGILQDIADPDRGSEHLTIYASLWSEADSDTAFFAATVSCIDLCRTMGWGLATLATGTFPVWRCTVFKPTLTRRIFASAGGVSVGDGRWSISFPSATHDVDVEVYESHEGLNLFAYRLVCKVEGSFNISPIYRDNADERYFELEGSYELLARPNAYVFHRLPDSESC